MGLKKWKFVNNLNQLVTDPLYLACMAKISI